MPTPKKSTKPAAKAPAKSESKSAASAAQPAVTIDPSNTALSVAASLAARARQNATPAAAGQTDSHAFKKFKEGVHKPAFSPTSPLAGGGKSNKFGATSSFARQVGHNQTSGPSVARTGVPRRTSGG